jgi:RNA polymerase sigma-70 factor (ECF subfamily)
VTAPQGVPTSPVAPAHTAPVAAGTRSDEEWLVALAAAGVEHELAVRDLHGLLVRAARHQVSRMRGMVPGWGEPRLEDLVQGAADDALVALLAKLTTFQGRSRFTTWAYKFAILEAATHVRRQAWAGREVAFADLSVVADAPAAGPAAEVEARDLGAAVVRAMDEVLTPYQRRIAVALLVDEVPIDVLAERLATNRGALYKTLHVARGRLRAALVASGHLSPPPATTGAGS